MVVRSIRGQHYRLVCCLGLLLVGQLFPSAQAADFTSDYHQAYSGDFNADGLQDIYVKSSPQILILAGDIVIPLALYQEIDHTLLTQNADNTYTVSYQLSDADIDTLSGWANQNYDLHLGDFNADGDIDVLLQAHSAGDNSVVLQAPVYGANPPVYLDTITSNTFGFDIASNNGVSLVVADLNADGRADITLARSGVADYLAYFQTGDTFNIAPVGVDDAVVLDEGATLNGNVLSNDIDAGVITATLNTAPILHSGVFNLNADGSFAYIHNGTEVFNDAFTYTVTDGDGATAVATVAISVTPVNDNAPVGVNDVAYVDEGAAVNGNVLLNDSDADLPGDNLSVVLDTGVDQGGLSLSANGDFSYTHNGSETDSDAFTYRVTDGVNTSGIIVMVLIVNPINNQTPIALNDGIYGLDEGATLTVSAAAGVLANDTDADAGDSLTASILEAPAHGSLSLNADGSFSYAHNGTDNFIDGFVYQVTDTANHTAVASVELYVAPVNHPAIPPAPLIDTMPLFSDAGSDAVGTTNGSFRVTEAGAATYTIPIVTAPGSGKVAPQLSLNYSNQGGNGVMGLGWSIGGLSAISRCRQTFETDGQNLAVGLTSTDRFCLDGQRLVVVDGSGSYGTADTEYKTEIDSQVKVYSRGGSDTAGPAYFEVYRKDGTTSIYGDAGTSASALMVANGENTGANLSWLIAEVKDSTANGNAITFNYSQHGVGEVLIDTIAYSQGSHEIEFIYASSIRPDVTSGYMVGSKYEQTQLLASVVSKADDSEIRSYQFEYQNTAVHGLTQLKSVKECNNSLCMNPTLFSWSDIDGEFEAVPVTTPIHDDSSGAKPGDFNGDGLQDLIWVEFSSLEGHLYLHLSLGSPTGFEEDYLVPGYGEGRLIRIDSDHTGAWHVLDYNNDGFDDVMYAIDHEWYVRLSNGQTIAGEIFPLGIAGAVNHTTIADFNGDGLADLAYVQGDELKIRYLEQNAGSYGFGAEVIKLIPNELITYIHPDSDPRFSSRVVKADEARILDVNGDGNVDLIVEIVEYWVVDPDDIGEYYIAKYRYWQVLLNPGVGSDMQVYFTAPAYEVPVGDSPSLVVADFNADGLADFLRVEPYKGTQCFLNTGVGYTDCGLIQDLVNSNTAFFGDADTDGAVELYYVTTDVFRAVWDTSTETFSDGVATNLFSIIPGHPVHNWQRFFSDVDGDGHMDYVTQYVYKYPAIAKQQVYFNKDAFKPSRVISRIENGLGAQVNINYHVLTDSNIPGLYNKGLDASSKSWGNGSAVFDINNPMVVVSEVQSSSPTAADALATRGIAYQYEDGKMQGGGRGFLGFRKVSTTDLETDIVTTTTYRQDFPYVGMPEYTVVEQPNEQKLAETTNQFSLNTEVCGDDDGTAFKPQAVLTTEKVYDLHDASLKSTAVTQTTFDGCGNVLEVDISTTDGLGNSYSKVSTNTYYDAADYNALFYGRLKLAVVAHSRNVGATPSAAITRTSSFDYSASSGLLTKETIEPGGGALELTVEHTFNDFGNRETTTQAATGYIDRRTESVFDSGGRYTDQRIDNFGNIISSITARNNLGQATKIEDMHGNEIRAIYGAFGRKYYQQNDTGGHSKVTFSECSIACTGAPDGTAYMVETITSGAPTTRVYYDLLGRERRAEVAGFLDSTFVYVDTEYDDQGRVSRKSEPYYLNDAIYWSVTSYDLLGRLIKIVHPDDSVTTTHYDGTLDHTTTLTNHLGQVTTRTNNVVGELVEVVDALQGKLTYQYDPQGNLIQVTSPGDTTLAQGGDAVVTTINYDLLGRKTSMVDPNKGDWSYEYSPFGELETQTDAANQVSQLTYDKAGRMLRRIDRIGGTGGPVVGDAVWSYNTTGALNELGMLAVEDIKIAGNSSSDIVRFFNYDAFGRAESVDTVIQNQGTFTQSTTFDQYGRVFQQFSAAEFNAGQQFEYNAQGYPYRVIEAQDSADTTHVYSEVLDLDARGNVIEEEVGGITVTRDYDSQTGRVSAIQASNGLIQDLRFSFDELGNLTNRTEYTASDVYSEDSQYDALNRLISATHGQSAPLEMTYGAGGNILTKSNIQGGASYEYGTGTAGPHAVTRVGSINYLYNANGDMISGDGRSMTYTTFGKPDLITKGNHSTGFAYGPNRNRFKRIDNASGEITTTLYLGNVEWIEKPDGVIETKRYIGGKNIITTSSVNPTPVELTVFTDHIGSTYALVNRATGGMIQGMSFDAFGLRRDTDWSDFSSAERMTFSGDNSSKGFTGHEQLDEVGLIHMNGRVYDPLLGRFISADPTIDGVTSTQGFNRYSYVHNNPLSYTDPSGFSRWVEFRDKILKPVVALVVSIVTAGAASGWAAAWGGAAFGTGTIANAVLAGAIIGGVTGFTNGLLYGGLSGAVQGAFSGFLKGAVTGAVGARLTKYLSGFKDLPKIVQRMAVGGTMSRLSGGKFVNGAAFAAFASIVAEGVNASSDSEPGTDHYSRNTENDQFLKEEGLYGRNDLTIDEVQNAGDYGMKQASDAESALHQYGDGNKNNIKLTSKVAHKESWFQRKWSNRYGRNEIILRPNSNGSTFTHVVESANMATLNLGNNPISHFFYDVIPYFRYGNVPGYKVVR